MIWTDEMNKLIKISIVVLLLMAAAYVAYDRIMDWHREGVEIAEKQLREEFELRARPVVPKEKLIKAFGEAPAEASPQERHNSPEEIERRIIAFFSYLDARDYIMAYKLKNGTYQYFRQTVDKLSANHPVIAGETESLFSLMKNMTYLFRVLGIEKIHLIKDVLKNEAEIIEQVMSNIYLWLTLYSAPAEKISVRPSLETSYEYSAYFLNTLAGKSYLMRRESKVRILTAYYCVLILDKANDAVLNSNGTDIRPHINSLLTEIRNQTGFVNKDQYYSKLKEMQEKYRL